ncbi:helix-turn-helix transcriptional regulator [Paraconexibacter antarcticus]|uniref:helix-turn-helix transcriptional regulator n=1 Tax=Paraconexibacter antarcticus TaxID=2949664 RepID=UPI0034617B51
MRQQAGMTQVQLAMKAGCSRASVALLEAGYEPRRSEVLKRVHAALVESTTSESNPGQGCSREGQRHAPHTTD